MKVVGSFNKVSDKLKKELIPTVKPNEVVRFQLLNGEYEPALGRVGFGTSKSIRLNDRIYDPYQTDSKGVEVGGYVDIGVPETIREGRVEKCKKFWVNSLVVGIPGNGQFEFKSGSVDDMEVMEFICLSNGNKNNPYRDESKEPQYEIVDAVKILEEEKQKDIKELKNKLRRFAKQNPDEAQEFIKMLSPNGKTDVTT